jgi:hypothetical protein
VNKFFRHISAHHLEQLLRTAFDIGPDNQCPKCGDRMVSIGVHTADCPPSSITITMECPACKKHYESFYGYRATMTNNIKVELEFF